MNWLDLLIDYIRSGLYLMCGMEAYFLWRLYYMAAKKMKGTPIIVALMTFMGFLAITMIVLGVATLKILDNPEVGELLRDVATLPLFLLWYSLSNFREKSLDNELPNICNIVK